MDNLHLEEIDHPSLIEFIDERFDGVTSLMTPNAVIYGSSLTSLISGLNADGDLDICASPSEYNDVAKNIQASSKWLQIEGTEVPDACHFNIDNGGHSLSHTLFGVEKSKNPYKDIPDFPLEETVAFKNITGAKVQLIKAKSNTTDPLHDSLSVVRKVDFAFCGMAMDRYGRLLESLPHAYSDCLARVIRIANYRAGDMPERMAGRLKKYLDRGWGLSIAYDLIFENMRRATLLAALHKPKKKTDDGILFHLGTFSGKFCIKTKGLHNSGITKWKVQELLNHATKSKSNRFDILIHNKEVIIKTRISMTQGIIERIIGRMNARYIAEKSCPPIPYTPSSGPYINWGTTT